MYKISIIIPVFNAEKFLKNTIGGIIKQTIGFENIELILVDDCSKDKSREIIQEYASKYDNIKPIFLEKNSGSASFPRNKGIENVTADYMLFLDSDDEIFEDYCETLYNAIINKDSDIVNCNCTNKLNNKFYISNSIKTINQDSNELNSQEKMFLKHTAWGNIYKTSLIKENNIKFPNTLHEDGVFSINCLLETNKPVFKMPNYPGYIYLIENEDSLTHKQTLKTFKKFLEGYKLCGDLLDEHNCKNIKKPLLSEFLNMSIFILVKLDNLNEGIKTLYEFENSLDFDIELPSKPLNFVNEKIISKQFTQAKILLKLMALLYNNKKIRNFIFIKFSDLKLME